MSGEFINLVTITTIVIILAKLQYKPALYKSPTQSLHRYLLYALITYYIYYTYLQMGRLGSRENWKMSAP